MAMEQYLYEKELVCPVCSLRHTTQKARLRKIPVDRKDSDFHVWYKEINPVFYNVWVCPNCGFSVTESEQKPLTIEQKALILKNISVKWTRRDFGGIRTRDQAVESHKLAILTGQLLGKSRGYLGGLCLRLAWLYREMENPEETVYLGHALKHLEEAYTNESFPVAGLDEVSLAYLIGELKRMLEQPKEAIFWYNRALEHPDIKHKRLIQLKAREQWHMAKEMNKRVKERSKDVESVL